MKSSRVMPDAWIIRKRNNPGCILNYGHIGLHCMVHSASVFRNLKVYTDRLPFTVTPRL